MPKTLNPINTFPTSIPNFPQAGNNEPVAIGPLENAIQAVLNRTENLHVRLLDSETNGVKRVRKFATLAALSAATGFSDGDVADVEGYGRYRLYNPSALTADGLWILTAAGGTGRWVHILNALRDANNGLATLTSGGRLVQNPQDGSILTAHLASGAVTASKLASGAAIANIGYTPVNKAGDTMSGNLVNTARMFVHRQAGATSPSISLAIGDEDTGFHWISDGVLAGYGNNSEAFRFTGAQFDFKVPFTGRYDHAQRWSISAFTGQPISINPNSFVVIGRTYVSVAAGKNLYLRRVRAYTADSPDVFRARVSTSSNVWVASSATLDSDVNMLLLTGPANGWAVLGIDNIDSVNRTCLMGNGLWAELEIR